MKKKISWNNIKPETQSVWGGEIETFSHGATQTPIVNSVAYGYDNLDEWMQVAKGEKDGHIYGRNTNPTVDVLEEKIRILEGAEAATSFSSGMAAISNTLFANLNAGDRVVAGKDTYGGTSKLFLEFLPQYDIEVVLCDTTDHDQIEKEVNKGCQLLYLETPTNPTLKIQDIKRLSSVGKKVGSLIVVDNTLATPINQNPLAFGADLAFISRSVIPSLFAAIWFGVWSLSGFSITKLVPSLLASFYHYTLNTMIDRDHAILILFTLMLGGMVGIIYRNGGMHGIIQQLVKKADTPKKGQIAIWLFGIIIFFDDYSNTLIVGNTSRLLCDKLKISRQKLAYLVDSTSAPIATVAIITTWIGFQVGIIADALPGLDGLNESAYMLFIHSIPYSFYPFLAIVLVGLVVTSGKDFGPMVQAEERARAGIKYAPNMEEMESDAGADSDDLFVKNNIKLRARNAVIPIAVLVFSMFYFIFTSGDGDTIKDIIGSSDTFGALMHSTLLSALVAAGLSIGQGILNVNETLDAWFSGLKFMLMGLLVLLLAWALADISKDLHTADYIVSTLGDTIPMSILPAVIFIIAAATAFGSGSSWGVMAILMPLVIPLTWAVMKNGGGATPENMHIMYSTIACVLTGSVWADHCSPISDTTILTSMASGCELMDHVRTQMPYAVSAGLAALLLGTLPAGFGFPWWALLLLGIGSQIIVVKLFGQKTS